jgi:uncharacterized protein
MPQVQSSANGAGGRLDRREIVATKVVCQIAGHALKLAYFGGIIEQAAALDPVLAALAVAASMLGTTLARRFLEAMTDSTAPGRASSSPRSPAIM